MPLINKNDISYKRFLLESIEDDLFYIKTFGDEQFAKPIEVLFSQETGKMVSSDDVKQLHLMGIASLDLYINQIRFEDSSLCNVTDDKVNEERRWALDWPTQGV